MTKDPEHVGWYPDPAEPRTLWRYWDGQAWTDDTRQIQATDDALHFARHTAPQPVVSGAGPIGEAPSFETAPHEAVRPTPPPPTHHEAVRPTPPPPPSPVGVRNCPDCGGTVSKSAPACIHCGRPNHEEPVGPPPPDRKLPPPAAASRQRDAAGKPIPNAPAPSYVANAAIAQQAAVTYDPRPGAVRANAQPKAKTHGYSGGFPKDTRTIVATMISIVTLLFAFGVAAGASIPELVVCLGLVVASLILISGSRRRAARRGLRPSWVVIVVRTMNVAAVILLGLGIYAFVHTELLGMTWNIPGLGF